MIEFSVYQWVAHRGEWVGTHRQTEREALTLALHSKSMGVEAFVARPDVVDPVETAGLLGYVWRGLPHTDPQRARQKRKLDLMGAL